MLVKIVNSTLLLKSIKLLLSRKIHIGLLLLIWLTIILIGYAKILNPEEGADGQTYSVTADFTSSKAPFSIDVVPVPGQESAYYLKPNEEFNGTYFLRSRMPSTTNYLLLAFLDYKQVPFYLDNKKSLNHKISIPINATKFLKLKTEPLREGFHDFIMILIWNPENHTLDETKRLNNMATLYSVQRVNFIVGQERRLPEMKKLQGKQTTNTQHFNDIIINKEDDSGKLKYWFKEKIKTGNEIRYYTHLGNQSQEPLGFTTITLLDFKQFAQNNIPYKGTIGPKKILTIPNELIAPKEKGIHELQVFYISKPFTKLPTLFSKIFHLY